MPELLNNLSVYFIELPWLELIAMLLSLAYVMLAAKGSIWCWPAAFLSTILYTYIFFEVMLLMDSALNAYYLIMAVYGYWQWSNPTTIDDNNPGELIIVSWGLSIHLKVCFLLTIISFVLGYLVSNYTPAHFPYLDTFTTVFAVFATYLITQKVLENWLYWIVIVLASIYLYVEKGLVPTTLLFIIFVVTACYGYLKWQNIYQKSAVDMQLTPVS